MDVTSEPGTTAMNALPSLAGWYTVGGKIYGAMVNGAQSDQPFDYNKKYFAKLGITPPTTLAELYAIADKIKADGKDPFASAGKVAGRLNLSSIAATRPHIRAPNGETTTRT